MEIIIIAVIILTIIRMGRRAVKKPLLPSQNGEERKGLSLTEDELRERYNHESLNKYSLLYKISQHPKFLNGLYLFQKLWWTIAAPIAGLLGYWQYAPIPSNEIFWIAYSFGFLFVIISNQPVGFSYDKSDDTYIINDEGIKLPRKRILINKGINRGIGLSLLCWAIGGKIASYWGTFEVIAAIIAFPIIIYGILSYFKEEF